MPVYLRAEQVARILKQTNRTTSSAGVTYAVLLLLARLGLRAGEVASLRLDDLNWEDGSLTIRGKGGRWARMPLSQEVGEAIVDYLTNGRPSSVDRRLFLRSHAPRTGIPWRNADFDHRVQGIGARAYRSPTAGARIISPFTGDRDAPARFVPCTDRRYSAASAPGHYPDLRKGRCFGIASTGDVVARRCAMISLRDAIEQYLTLRRDLASSSPGHTTCFASSRASWKIRTHPSLPQTSHCNGDAASPCSVLVVGSEIDGGPLLCPLPQAPLTPARRSPPQDLLRYRPQRARPYLYTEQDIERLMGAARRCGPPADYAD